MLRRSCDQIDLQDGQWSPDGHSPKYGHGRLNAETAVRLATPQIETVVPTPVSRARR